MVADRPSVTGAYKVPSSVSACLKGTMRLWQAFLSLSLPLSLSHFQLALRGTVGNGRTDGRGSLTHDTVLGCVAQLCGTVLC